MSSVLGIQNTLDYSIIKNNGISSSGITKSVNSASTDRTSSFDSVFNAIMNQINETNNLTNVAEEEEIKFAMGLSDSTHDLQIAQEKANVSLNYTIALRRTILDAYKEIMNLQF